MLFAAAAVCLAASLVAATPRYIYVMSRPDGFNNQMNQIWLNLYLALLHNRTAAPTDLWPDWSWDRTDSTLHFPFSKYFVVDQSVVRTASLARLGADCPVGLHFFGNAQQFQWWKTDMLHIKHTLEVSHVSVDKWLEGAPDCAGVNAAMTIPNLGPPHVSYYHTAREGPAAWLRVRAATRWSVALTRAAVRILRELRIERYAALHVRRGDYLRHHCTNHASFNIAERRYVCPSDADVAEAIAAMDGDLSVFVLTNDRQLVPSLRRMPTVRRRVVGTQDVPPPVMAALRYEFGIDATELGVVEQVVGTLADVFVGVPISSFTGTIMSGRDTSGVLYECTLTWQSVLTRGANCSRRAARLHDDE